MYIYICIYTYINKYKHTHPYIYTLYSHITDPKKFSHPTRRIWANSTNTAESVAHTCDMTHVYVLYDSIMSESIIGLISSDLANNAQPPKCPLSLALSLSLSLSLSPP